MSDAIPVEVKPKPDATPPRPVVVETPSRRFVVPPRPDVTVWPYAVNLNVERNVEHGGKRHEAHIVSAVVGLRSDDHRDYSVSWRLSQGEMERAPSVDLQELATRVLDAKTLLDLLDAFGDAIAAEAASENA